VLIGIAIATKPWAVMFLPLALEELGPWRRRLRPVVVAGLIGALAWAPFVVHDTQTLHSLRPTVNVAADSVLSLFGASNEPPGWMRVAQLVLALVVASAAVLRRVPEGVILAAVAVRLGTDPGTWSYYTAGLALGALAWDLVHVRRTVPVTTLMVAVLLPPTWLVPSDGLRAMMRLVACVAAIVIVLRARPIDAVERRAISVDDAPGVHR
jgi:hypothetical protein